MQPNIAFTGKAGSGKTTCAEMLVKYLGYERRSFAAPLKDIAARLWGESARTNREKLQRLGVAVREIDKGTWANLLVNEAVDLDVPVVVDDLRFPNEFWALRRADFKVIRVAARDSERAARLQANGKAGGDPNHVSETALDRYVPDAYIFNDDGKIEHTWTRIQTLVTGWDR